MVTYTIMRHNASPATKVETNTKRKMRQAIYREIGNCIFKAHTYLEALECALNEVYLFLYIDFKAENIDPMQRKKKRKQNSVYLKEIKIRLSISASTTNALLQ